jgi:hypothetical protein
MNEVAKSMELIKSRVKGRFGFKTFIYCFTRQRNPINQELIITTCKLESALIALKGLMKAAKRYKSPLFLELASEQLNDIDYLINNVETFLNF